MVTDLPGGPPVLQEEPTTGEIMIGWPQGRPASLLVSAQNYEGFFWSHNQMMRLIRLQAEVIGMLGRGVEPSPEIRADIEELRRLLAIP